MKKLLLPVAIIIAVGILGGVWYWYDQHNSEITKVSEQATVNDGATVATDTSGWKTVPTAASSTVTIGSSSGWSPSFGSAAPHTPAIGWKQYKNTELGFSIDYPADWVMDWGVSEQYSKAMFSALMGSTTFDLAFNLYGDPGVDLENPAVPVSVTIGGGTISRGTQGGIDQTVVDAIYCAQPCPEQFGNYGGEVQFHLTCNAPSQNSVDANRASCNKLFDSIVSTFTLYPTKGS